MTRVAIESPYKPYGLTPGTPEYRAAVADNERFAEHCCREAVVEGLNPFAMHLFFTRFLNDAVDAERVMGLERGLAWTDFADTVRFCLREGESLTPGMLKAVARNRSLFPTRPMTVRTYGFHGFGSYRLLSEAPL